jgi:hypothetical protein
MCFPIGAAYLKIPNGLELRFRSTEEFIPINLQVPTEPSENGITV